MHAIFAKPCTCHAPTTIWEGTARILRFGNIARTKHRFDVAIGTLRGSVIAV